MHWENWILKNKFPYLRLKKLDEPCSLPDSSFLCPSGGGKSKESKHNEDRSSVGDVLEERLTSIFAVNGSSPLVSSTRRATRRGTSPNSCSCSMADSSKTKSTQAIRARRERGWLWWADKKPISTSSPPLSFTLARFTASLQHKHRALRKTPDFSGSLLTSSVNFWMTPSDPTRGRRQPWEHILANVFSANSSKGLPDSPVTMTPSWARTPERDTSLAHSTPQPRVSSWRVLRAARLNPWGYSGAIRGVSADRVPWVSNERRLEGVSQR